MSTTQKIVDPEGSRPVVSSNGRMIDFFRTWVNLIGRYMRELTMGDNADNLHIHSDAGLEGTLVDDSMADALHRHSELSASDGTPNKAVQVDASGQMGVGVVPNYDLEINHEFGISMPTVNHSMTVLAPSTVYAWFSNILSTAGGCRFTGLVDSGAGTALYLRGVIGRNNPIDTVPAVNIVGGKYNGSTSWTALGDNETVIQFTNFGTTLGTFLGSGNLGIGIVSPIAKVDIVGDADTEQLKVQSHSTQNDDVAQIGDISSGNYLAVEDDGTIRFTGNATVYNDIQFSMSTAKVPAANAPSWNTFTANTKKYTFAVDDYVDLEGKELEHSYDEGEDIQVHIHFFNNVLEAGDTDVKYEVTYCITPKDGTASETTISAQFEIPADTPDKTHFIETIGTITGTGFTIGDDITLRFRRIADVGGTDPANDPFVSMIGIHIPEDTQGSRQVAMK